MHIVSDNCVRTISLHTKTATAVSSVGAEIARILKLPNDAGFDLGLQLFVPEGRPDGIAIIRFSIVAEREIFSEKVGQYGPVVVRRCIAPFGYDSLGEQFLKFCDLESLYEEKIGQGELTNTQEIVKIATNLLRPPYY